MMMMMIVSSTCSFVHGAVAIRGRPSSAGRGPGAGVVCVCLCARVQPLHEEGVSLRLPVYTRAAGASCQQAKSTLSIRGPRGWNEVIAEFKTFR